MIRKPLISCVLPTHNGSRYIDQSIQSVIEQTFTDWELIIVDDASTDDTPARIRRWAARESRVKPVFLPLNRKLPGALNEGFRHALGEYFTWTSDDNWYDPEAFGSLTSVLNARPDVGLVYADMTVVDARGRLLNPFPFGRPEDLAFDNCVGACFLYRRSVHERLRGYDEDLFLVEDYDFWLRASNDFLLEPLYRRLYWYRSHSAALTTTRQPAVLISRERALGRWLPTARWLGLQRLRAGCVSWAVGTFSLDPRRGVFSSWLEEHTERLGKELLCGIQEDLPGELIRVAVRHCEQRRWEEFEATRAFLAAYSADPRVADFLAMRIRPAWYYAIKDSFQQVSATWRQYVRNLRRSHFPDLKTD